MEHCKKHLRDLGGGPKNLDFFGPLNGTSVVLYTLFSALGGSLGTTYRQCIMCSSPGCVGLTEQWMNITVSIRPPPLISPHTLLNDNVLKETFKKPVSFRPPSLPKI